MSLPSVVYLLTESGLNRTCPSSPRARTTAGLEFMIVRVVESKGMEKGWYGFLCKTFLDLLCNVCFTVLFSGQLKVLDRSFLEAAELLLNRVA